MKHGSVTRIAAGAFLALAMTGAAWAKVDVNHATEQQLQALNGIGPAKAHAIVVERRAHGPYQKLADLSARVPGIGATTVAGLASEASFGPSGTVAAAAPSSTTKPQATPVRVATPAPVATPAQKTAAHVTATPAPVHVAAPPTHVTQTTPRVAPSVASHTTATPKGPVKPKTPTHP